MVRWSEAPRFFFKPCNSFRRESRMLRLCFMRAARTSGVAPLPNSRSKTTCGFNSIGSGVVAVFHEMEFVYEQLYPSPQLLELEFGSSTASCSEGSRLSWPIFCAITWSIVGLPTLASEPAVFLGLIAVRNAAATQWSEPVVPSGGSADLDHRPVITTV